MDTRIRPVWNAWRSLPTIKRWQGVALSLDLNPRRLQSSDWQNNEELDEIHPEFADRLMVVNAARDLQPTALSLSDPAESSVNLVDFVVWVSSIGWKVPAEFTRLAAPTLCIPAPTFSFQGAVQAAYWMIDEGAAYTLNLHPSTVAKTYIGLLPAHTRAEFTLRQDLALRAVEAGELHAINLPQTFIRAYMDAPKIRTQDFIAWARVRYSSIAPELEAAITAFMGASVDWKARYEQERQERERVQREFDQLHESKWPWGDYGTPLLWEVAAAVERWWKPYDPSQPETAPTNEQVADWLAKRKVAAPRVASIMAQVIRADGLQLGRRKSRKQK